MKLEEGMYVRTKEGTIAKIEQILNDELHWNIKPVFSDGECLGYKWCYIKDVKNASYNIIDLIEVGDYVNGCLVEKSKWNYQGINFIQLDTLDGLSWVTGTMPEKYIKSIVTKEQFENMKYKVE